MGDAVYLAVLVIVGIAGAVVRFARGGRPYPVLRRSTYVAFMGVIGVLLAVAAATEMAHGLWVAGVLTALFVAVMLGLAGMVVRRRTFL